MNPPDHDAPAMGRDDNDEGLPLPCPHGLMAATLALMTRWAVPEPGCRLAQPDLRHILARKVVSNLFFLQQHPQVPPGLRRVAQGLHTQWLPLTVADTAHPASADTTGPIPTSPAPLLH